MKSEIIKEAERRVTNAAAHLAAAKAVCAAYPDVVYTDDHWRSWMATENAVGITWDPHRGPRGVYVLHAEVPVPGHASVKVLGESPGDGALMRIIESFAASPEGAALVRIVRDEVLRQRT